MGILKKHAAGAALDQYNCLTTATYRPQSVTWHRVTDGKGFSNVVCALSTSVNCYNGTFNASKYTQLKPYASYEKIEEYVFDTASKKDLGISATMTEAMEPGTKILTISLKNTQSDEKTINSIKLTKTVYSQSNDWVVSDYSGEAVIWTYYLDDSIILASGESTTVVIKFDFTQI